MNQVASRFLLAAAQQYLSAIPPASLGQQQIAAISNRHLRYLREPLQKPGQTYFDPHMIIGHIDMTRCCLPQRANAKDHAIVLPPLLIDLEHRDAGGRARQSGLQPTRRLFAAKGMRNRNDKGSGHFQVSGRCGLM
jgi:hypothetical protein